ncbi:MAG TPA: hypothetical protein VM432_08875 [Bdellovibrionales bacterium]|nr:hypothetical protein [Bdellovibrionales bacterium]
MRLLETLLSTDSGSFLVGLYVGLSVVMGVVAFGLFWVFRLKTLLYFGISTLLMFFVLAVAPPDPRSVDLGGPAFQFGHFIILLILFFWYRTEMSMERTSRRPLALIRMVTFFAVTTFVLRLIVILSPSMLLLRMTSISSILFLSSSIVLIFTGGRQTRGERLMSAGFVLICLQFIFFGLVRSGIMSVPDWIVPAVPYFIALVLTSFSVLCIFGLILIGKETRVREEIRSYESTARNYLDMRDQMNTPLQTLECILLLLKDGPEKTVPDTLPAFTHALERLRRINDVLMRYESKMTTE